MCRMNISYQCDDRRAQHSGRAIARHRKQKMKCATMHMLSYLWDITEWTQLDSVCLAFACAGFQVYRGVRVEGLSRRGPPRRLGSLASRSQL